jgi:hypothetical protein
MSKMILLLVRFFQHTIPDFKEKSRYTIKWAASKNSRDLRAFLYAILKETKNSLTHTDD